jgi:hypothetical protein
MRASITVTVHFTGGYERTLTIEFTPRKYGGWVVSNVGTGRLLGWLVYDKAKPVRTRWEARAYESAFRGDGLDGTSDAGHELDFVPAHLVGRVSSTMYQAVGLAKSRTEAAYELLHWLCEASAPAVGFESHPEVRRWEDSRAV